MITCIFLDTVDKLTEDLIRLAVPENAQLFFLNDLNEKERSTYLEKADALLTATYIVDKALMKQCKNLKIVQKTGVGTDNIDKSAAAALGIKVDNVPGGNADGVAELTMGLILAIYRNIIPLAAMARQKKWAMWAYRGSSFEIRGKTHGIIGFGHIGKRTAQLSNAFGSKLLYYNRTRQTEAVEYEYGIKYEPLDILLQKSDIISIHLPFSPQTKNLINKDRLELIKDTAVIINVGRGGIINEDALYREMKNGRFLGAGIDVWEKEPFDSQNQLVTLPNVIATPHVGAGTLDTMRSIYKMCFEKIMTACIPRH